MRRKGWCARSCRLRCGRGSQSNSLFIHGSGPSSKEPRPRSHFPEECKLNRFKMTQPSLCKTPRGDCLIFPRDAHVASGVERPALRFDLGECRRFAQTRHVAVTKGSARALACRLRRPRRRLSSTRSVNLISGFAESGRVPGGGAGNSTRGRVRSLFIRGFIRRFARAASPPRVKSSPSPR